MQSGIDQNRFKVGNVDLTQLHCGELLLRSIEIASHNSCGELLLRSIELLLIIVKVLVLTHCRVELHDCCMKDGIGVDRKSVV